MAPDRASVVRNQCMELSELVNPVEVITQSMVTSEIVTYYNPFIICSLKIMVPRVGLP
jgi:hypothetical protein